MSIRTQKELADAVKALVSRRGDRAAECTGLENLRVFTGTVGSNPTLSAIFYGGLNAAL